MDGLAPVEKRVMLTHSNSCRANFVDTGQACTQISSTLTEFHPKKIPISLNLPAACKLLAELLHRLNQHVDYLGPPRPGINETVQLLALYRYEKLWLPLAAEHKLYAGAPIDVHWIWLAHMLNPLCYRQDCQHITGRLVEHRLVSHRKSKQMINKARTLWQSRYPGDPFDFDPNRTGYRHLIDSWNSKNNLNRMSCDLLTTAQTSPHFFYQVSLPHFQQREFLKDAVRRYRQFLHVRKLFFFIVQAPSNPPTAEALLNTADLDYLPNDIELAWRAHLFHPRIYARDTSCTFGKILSHPCNPLECTMFSRFSDLGFFPKHQDHVNSTGPTILNFPNLWMKHFPDQPLIKPGCLNRGSSSRGKLNDLDNLSAYKLATKCTQVTINRVSARLRTDLEKFAIRIQQHGLTMTECELPSGTGNCMVSLHPPGRLWTLAHADQAVARFTMVTGASDQISVELVDKRGWLCPTNTLLGSGVLKLTKAIENFVGAEPTDRELSCVLQLDDQWNNSQGSLSEQKCAKNKTTAAYQQNGRKSETPDCSKCSPSTAHSQSSTQKKPSISFGISINPPVKHVVHLRVQVGLPIVCSLPPPNEQKSSLGYRIWGPVPNARWFTLSDGHHFEQNGLPFETNTSLSCDACFSSKLKDASQRRRSLVLVHRIVNHLNEHVLSVRVLHNVDERLSVVQVYSGDQLLSVGHVVGLEQLPEIGSRYRFRASEQRSDEANKNAKLKISKKYLEAVLKSVLRKSLRTAGTHENEMRRGYSEERLSSDSLRSGNQSEIWGLNSELEERAMLVKDSKGDRCLVIGRWTGFRRFPQSDLYGGVTMATAGGPTNATLPTSSTHGNGGYLSLRIIWLDTADFKNVHVQVPDSMNNYSMILREASVNMKTGEIHISKDCNEIAQNVCLAFCCGVLHVLCQPRILAQETTMVMTPTDCVQGGSPNDEINALNRSSDNLADDYDLDMPTTMSTSTSFDSVVPTAHEIDSQRVERVDNVHMPTVSLDNVKLQWKVDHRPPGDWCSEIADLVDLGEGKSDAAENTKGGGKEFPLKVHGLATCQVVTSTNRHGSSAESSPNIYTTRDLTQYIKEVYAFRKTDQLLASYGRPSSTKRGIPASLTFVMCRAAGLPIDALIPSVQLLREHDRCVVQTHPLLLQNTLTPTCSPQVSSNGRIHIPSDSLSNREFIRYKATRCNGSVPFSPNPNPGYVTQQQDQQPTIFVTQPTNQSRGQCERVRQTLPPQTCPTCKRKTDGPLVWRLKDFYDLFYLELPDICSGCVYGCQFCNGTSLF
ncbi:unnamed protein product [Calicophoron daubneyi]|uniref:Uncharacterized protein n=1 Tax=Calicophoron daubneyi TaxID=300641 RepID=A0AAV2T9B2_CALDB